ncbi:5-hydroxytryptamine receptor 3A-like [Cololabis saira]|uniref:5-hydroxytryptamine receptor 3A-like n=1 Tax=Cololabis saira TaxID=129043 RepID=UPI002AD22B6E|nr:5-hydroxytryptamine receptor 3A-like [Cololabis saira]
MRCAAFLLLLILTDGVSCKVCSYQDILDYLNLTTDNSVYKLTRPVLDHTHVTVVKLNLVLYAILAVVEKTQTFIPFLWASVRWRDERISWDPDDFCGITHVSVPRDLLWAPDLFFYEMVEKDNSPQNPYMFVFHDGTVSFDDDMRVVSTCKMDVHKFPFDTQECNISISSASFSVNEMQIVPISNSSRATQFSREIIMTQGEWEFLQVSINNVVVTFDETPWEMLTYTFTIKRRPLLHVINFVLPILFFLSLDLASFLIADHRGEKLGFKVTVLLAISVLLLILNEILPSMSNRTPLIATYCIVIFALMLLSLLETILVTYLLEKDSHDRLRLHDKQEDDREQFNTKSCSAEDERQTCCSCICKVPESKKQHELLPVVEEVNNDVQLGDSHVLLLILEELRKLQKTTYLQFSCRKEDMTSACWAKRINKAFFIFYIITVFLFFLFIFTEWNS